jgi:hypothetical protein
MINACRVLVGQAAGKQPFERPRGKWENIKMDLKK